MLDRKPAEELNIPFALIFYLKISLSSISLHSETFHFQPRNFSISFVSCLISDACFPLHLFLTGFLIFSHRFSRDPALTNVFHDQTFKYIFFRLIHRIHKWRTRGKKLVPSHESEALEGKQKLQTKTFSELAECLARIPPKITLYGRLFKYNYVGRLLLLMFSTDLLFAIKGDAYIFKETG